MRKQTNILLFSLLILLNMSSIQAQTKDINLDQVELMKKFIGTWEGEFGDNSLFMSENTQFAKGIISKSNITMDGKIIESVVQLFGYDNKTDKFIMAELKESSSVIEICSTWFTSENTGEIIITNPNDAPFRFKFEFISPDKIVQTAIKDNQIVNEIILSRVHCDANGKE